MKIIVKLGDRPILHVPGEGASPPSFARGRMWACGEDGKLRRIGKGDRGQGFSSGLRSRALSQVHRISDAQQLTPQCRGTHGEARQWRHADRGCGVPPWHVMLPLLAHGRVERRMARCCLHALQGGLIQDGVNVWAVTRSLERIRRTACGRRVRKTSRKMGVAERLHGRDVHAGELCHPVSSEETRLNSERRNPGTSNPHVLNLLRSLPIRLFYRSITNIVVPSFRPRTPVPAVLRRWGGNRRGLSV